MYLDNRETLGSGAPGGDFPPRDVRVEAEFDLRLLRDGLQVGDGVTGRAPGPDRRVPIVDPATHLRHPRWKPHTLRSDTRCGQCSVTQCSTLIPPRTTALPLTHFSPSYARIPARKRARNTRRIWILRNGND